MRFREFRTLSIDEAKKPPTMTLSQLNKGEGKYIHSIMTALDSDTTLNFFMKGEIFSGKVKDAELIADELEKVYNDVDYMEDPSKIPIIVQTEDGEDIKAFIGNIIKDEISKGAFTFNLGNIAEAIMGSAMTAKFEKEGGQVTAEEVKEVGRRLFESQGRLVSTSGKDNLSFTMTVPTRDAKALSAFLGTGEQSLKELGVDDDKIKEIEKLYQNAATYVNTSKRAQAAVDKAAADPNENNVEVLSDGGNAEKQSITKVDLEILYDGQKINLISLKAGAVKQIGQESGAEFATLDRFFQTSVGFGLPQEMANDFLPKTDPKYKDYNYHYGFPNAYRHIYNTIKEHVDGINPMEEYNIVESVYKGINYHGTRNEQGVILLVLSPDAKKAYYELTLGDDLLNELQNYDLDVALKAEGKNYIIEVYGIAKTDKARQLGPKSKLIQLRSLKQENAVRNVLEIGPLLKDLADLEKLDAKKDQKLKAQPSEQPIIQAPPKPNDELDQVKKLAGIKKPTKNSNRIPGTTTSLEPTETEPTEQGVVNVR